MTVVLAFVLSPHLQVVMHAADGDLDPAFGTGGKVLVDLYQQTDNGWAVAIQPDGKIVATGRSTGAPVVAYLAVARLNVDGSLDPTFGDGGVVTTIIGRIAEGRAVVIQPDGKILIGSVDYSAFDDDFALVRYNSDGSLDTSFGGDGIVTTSFGPMSESQETVAAVVLQSDGRIVAAGVRNDDFALARYNADGSLDPTFGSAGIVITDLGGTEDEATSVAIQRDGRIVAMGETVTGDAADFAVARYNADGLLDSTFGTGGLVTTDIAMSSLDTMGGVAIQADGGIVAAGTTSYNINGEGGTDFALVRYEGSAPHAVTFFLHGNDVPGTASGFTMDLTAPVPQLLVRLPRSASWFSDPVASGTFLSGSRFEVTLPCTFGVIGFPKTVRLASTDATGGGEQPLGEVAVGLEICQSQTIAVPVTTPVAFAQRRLKLTLITPLPVSPPLRLGEQTFLRVTEFAGTP